MTLGIFLHSSSHKQISAILCFLHTSLKTGYHRSLLFKWIKLDRECSRNTYNGLWTQWNYYPVNSKKYSCYITAVASKYFLGVQPLGFFVYCIEEPFCKFPQLSSCCLRLLLKPHVILPQMLYLCLENCFVLFFLVNRDTSWRK